MIRGGGAALAAKNRKLREEEKNGGGGVHHYHQKKGLKNNEHVIKVLAFLNIYYVRFIEHPELADFVPDNRAGHSYKYLAVKSKEIVVSNQFNGFIIGCICIAGVLVGLQTYGENAVYTAMDNIILGVFTLEVVIKIVAEAFRPWMYFFNKEWRWNNFDFWIVFLCLGIIDTGSGSSLALLRLLRLMRVAKIVKKVPQLQMIVMGLVGGLSSIGYILLLLFLAFYLYAIVGVMLFADNDPWHFGGVFIALLTLFRACTFEDWSDLFYINYFGCDEYSNVYITDPDEWTEENEMYWCTTPRRRNLISAPYWVSFIVICSLVMLALFIGAVTMSMQSSMVELKMEKEATEAAKREEKKRRQLLKQKSQSERSLGVSPRNTAQHDLQTLMLQMKTVHKLKHGLHKAASAEQGPPRPPPPPEGASPAAHLKYQLSGLQHKARAGSRRLQARLGLGARAGSKRGGAGAGAAFDAGAPITSTRELLRWRDFQEKSVLKELLVACWEGREVSADALAAAEAVPPLPPALGGYYRLSLLARRVVEDPRFVNLITGVICLAGVLVGIQTFEFDWQVYNAQGSAVFDFDAFFENFILAIFTLEVGLKIIAEHYRPWRYFRGGWNNFDFVIVLGSYMPVGGASGMLVLLRLLRLLRVLKLVKSLPQLAVIVNAMIMGMRSIGFIGVILGLVYYVFAIMGWIMFNVNDPWHFGTLHMAVLTLFRCSTLEDWTDVMYINMFGCDLYGYDDTMVPGCTNPQPTGWWAALYFIVFTVLAALVLLTLFIGVVSTSMDEAQQEQAEEASVQTKLQRFSEDNAIGAKHVQLYQRVFVLLDIDGGGTIEDEELALGLQNAGLLITSDQIAREAAEALRLAKEEHYAKHPEDRPGEGEQEDEGYAYKNELDIAAFVMLIHGRRQRALAGTLTPCNAGSRRQPAQGPSPRQGQLPELKEENSMEDSTAGSPARPPYWGADAEDAPGAGKLSEGAKASVLGAFGALTAKKAPGGPGSSARRPRSAKSGRVHPDGPAAVHPEPAAKAKAAKAASPGEEYSGRTDSARSFGSDAPLLSAAQGLTPRSRGSGSGGEPAAPSARADPQHVLALSRAPSFESGTDGSGSAAVAPEPVGGASLAALPKPQQDRQERGSSIPLASTAVLNRKSYTKAESPTTRDSTESAEGFERRRVSRNHLILGAMKPSGGTARKYVVPGEGKANGAGTRDTSNRESIKMTASPAPEADLRNNSHGGGRSRNNSNWSSGSGSRQLPRETAGRRNFLRSDLAEEQSGETEELLLRDAMNGDGNGGDSLTNRPDSGPQSEFV